ncbi:rCG41321 [Rattus norvegicus]|uniref:RCG41321 n=1 Tax=Rattus norvegicus TaxID=10116 RepID=A6II26_RAT|nr:rCG41321 [Rattus norvegicus]
MCLYSTSTGEALLSTSDVTHRATHTYAHKLRQSAVCACSRLITYLQNALQGSCDR